MAFAGIDGPLRNGDIVVLLCEGPPGWEGILGAAEFAGGDRETELEVTYERSSDVKDMTFHRGDVLSTSLWRVETPKGESSPGGPLRRFRVKSFLVYCPTQL